MKHINLVEILVSNQIEDICSFDWLSTLKFTLDLKENPLTMRSHSPSKRNSPLKQNIPDIIPNLIDSPSQVETFEEVQREQEEDQPNRVGQTALASMMRRKFRTKLEEQAISEAQTMENEEWVKTLNRLYKGMVEVDDPNDQGLYFEQSNDYL